MHERPANGMTKFNRVW